VQSEHQQCVKMNTSRTCENAHAEDRDVKVQMSTVREVASARGTRLWLTMHRGKQSRARFSYIAEQNCVLRTKIKKANGCAVVLSANNIQAMC
jgi:hypothetical protein